MDVIHNTQCFTKFSLEVNFKRVMMSFFNTSKAMLYPLDFEGLKVSRVTRSGRSLLLQWPQTFWCHRTSFEAETQWQKTI